MQVEYICPVCKKGCLKFRDYCRRILRSAATEEPEWLDIPRCQCSNSVCAKVHRMLPDFMVPYKQYKDSVIEAAVDDRPQPSEADNPPSRKLMMSWKLWIAENVLNIDRQLKHAGCRERDFMEELLKSGDSILQQMRSSIPEGWLKTVLRVIYNSGGILTPFYY